MIKDIIVRESKQKEAAANLMEWSAAFTRAVRWGYKLHKREESHGAIHIGY
jgi:hypothetical protein